MSVHGGDVYFDIKANKKPFNSAMRSLDATAGKIAGKVGRTIAAALSVAAFGKFIKDATAAGASLNAMNTIVDAALPNMREKVDEFAKSAGAMFGLSETQAKKFVGQYASMARSMGYTEEQAYKMSTALAGLAGDYASYYHISQDAAATKLKAVFSGETEALKEQGIVMTQNALNAYALANGYGRTTAQMSELEKTTLRYNFLLNQTKLAHGDFAKYANTWSGSIATMKLNWSNFMATLGQGLINILLPLLQVIARISQALTALGSRFLAWTQRVRGIKKPLTAAFGKGTQKDLKKSAGGIGNVGKGLGGAGKSAKSAKKAVKALKRELMGFDQITKLTKQDTNTGTGSAGGIGGGGGISGGDLGLDDYDPTQDAKNYVDKWIQRIKEAWAKEDFSSIGHDISQKIADSLNKINWDDVKANVNRVMKSLATFITGFFGNSETWQAVGHTIAEGLNTAFSGLKTFADNVKWSDIGKALGDGFNKFIEDFNIEAAAETISDTALDIEDFLIAAIGEIDWGKVGKKIMDGLTHIKWGELLVKSLQLDKLTLDSIGQFQDSIFLGLCKIVNSICNKIATYIKEKALHIWDSLGDGLGDTKKKLEQKWQDIKGWWDGLKLGVKEAAANFKDNASTKITSLKQKWDNLKLGAKEAVANVKDSLSSKVDAIKKKWDKFSLKDKTAKVGINLKNSLTSAWNSLAGKVNAARKKSKIVAGILPAFPKLAEGGWLKKNAPQLAMVGDNRHHPEIVAPDDKLAAMAKQAATEAAGANSQQVIALLTALLQAVNDIDTNVYLDGEAIKNNTVRRINNHTRSTGQLELLI